MTPQEAIDIIKTKAVTFAKKHSVENVKAFYGLGKRHAASTFMAMVRNDGANAAILDIAKEILAHEDNADAKWILENDTWKI